MRIAGVPLVLTVDGWFSKVQRKSYLGITGHYLDSDACEMRNFPLGIRVLGGESHTGENLLKCLNSALSERQVDPKFVVQIVTDNGGNVVRMANLFFNACRTSLFTSPHRCAAHTIQRIVLEILSAPHVMDVIKPISKAVKYIRSPETSALPMLLQFQERDGLDPLTVIQSVDTRWGSLLEMLKRYIQIKTYIDEVLKKMNRPSPNVRTEDVDVLIQILGPLEKMTTMLSGESYSSLGMICILAKRHLSRIMKDMEEDESVEDILPPESSSFEVSPSEEIQHILRTLNPHDFEMTDKVPSCSLDKVALQRIVFSGLKNRFSGF